MAPGKEFPLKLKEIKILKKRKLGKEDPFFSQNLPLIPFLNCPGKLFLFGTLKCFKKKLKNLK